MSNIRRSAQNKKNDYNLITASGNILHFTWQFGTSRSVNRGSEGSLIDFLSEIKNRVIDLSLLIPTNFLLSFWLSKRRREIAEYFFYCFSSLSQWWIRLSHEIDWVASVCRLKEQTKIYKTYTLALFYKRKGVRVTKLAKWIVGVTSASPSYILPCFK